jgi:hypothetical protein
MAFGCFYDVPGDEEIYAKVKAEIGEDAPKGLILQVVSKAQAGGLRHLTVWESREQWERFQAERVGPAVGKVLAAMGITEAAPRPVITELDLVDVITAG